VLGIATLNVGQASSELVVWLTSQVEEFSTRHTNAVVIQRDDPKFASKVWSLTADRFVVTLVPSRVPGLEADPLSFDSAMHLLRREVEARRATIEAAIHAYAQRTRSNLVAPRWAELPTEAPAEPHWLESGTVSQTLAAANHISKVWNAWLDTEKQRLRRIESPKGQRPWIMPGGLDSPSVEVLPAEYVAMARDAFVRVAPRA